MELDKFKNVDLVLDRANDTFIAKQVVSHGDYQGRTLTVQITNGGEVGSLPDAQLVLHWKNIASGLSDDSAFTLIDAENAIFRIEYPTNMLTPGTVKANILVIYQGKTTVSREFEITVANVAGQSTGVLAKAEFSALVAALSEANGISSRLIALESGKSDKSYVDSLVSSIASGGPKELFYSIQALNQKYPNGEIGTFLVLDASLGDGAHSFIWSDRAWKDLGVYQATQLDEKNKVSAYDYVISKNNFFKNPTFEIASSFKNSSDVVTEIVDKANIKMLRTVGNATSTIRSTYYKFLATDAPTLVSQVNRLEMKFITEKAGNYQITFTVFKHDGQRTKKTILSEYFEADKIYDLEVDILISDLDASVLSEFETADISIINVDTNTDYVFYLGLPRLFPKSQKTKKYKSNFERRNIDLTEATLTNLSIAQDTNLINGITKYVFAKDITWGTVTLPIDMSQYGLITHTTDFDLQFMSSGKKYVSVKIKYDGLADESVIFEGDIDAYNLSTITFTNDNSISDKFELIVQVTHGGNSFLLALHAEPRKSKIKHDSLSLIKSDSLIFKIAQAQNNAVKYTLNTYFPTKFSNGVDITDFGGFTEHALRHPLAAAFGIATLLKTGLYDSSKTGVSETDAKNQAIRIIRSASKLHAANGGGWTGVGWQDALWCFFLGATGQLLWSDLSEPTRLLVRNVVKFQADVIIDDSKLSAIGFTNGLFWKNRNGEEIYVGDSKSEELAWDASILCVAILMIPNDTNLTLWKKRLVEWSVKAFSTPSDLTSNKKINGYPLSDLGGYNVRDDGVIINHNLVHPDYMVSATSSLWAGASLMMFNEKEVPRAVFTNARKIARALYALNLSGDYIYRPDGSIYYPQGNDWGTSRITDKIAFDAIAYKMGFDDGAGFEDFGKLHADINLNMQKRFPTGATYANGTIEDNYGGEDPWGRESWVSCHLASALLALSVDKLITKDDWYN